MNHTLLREELIFFEGLKYQTYNDSEGLLTGGIGHLIQPGDGFTQPNQQISARIVEEWFCKDTALAIDRCKNIIGVDTFNSLDEVRQRILVNLTFNLGNRLAGFKKFIAALKAKDFVKAAAELKDSKWYVQVGRRGPITCNAMINGFYSGITN